MSTHSKVPSLDYLLVKIHYNITGAMLLVVLVAVRIMESNLVSVSLYIVKGIRAM
jgi:hypothetical protein